MVAARPRPGGDRPARATPWSPSAGSSASSPSCSAPGCRATTSSAGSRSACSSSSVAALIVVRPRAALPAARRRRPGRRVGARGDHRHAPRDLTRLRRRTAPRSSDARPASSARSGLAARRRSWATIILTSDGKSTSGRPAELRRGPWWRRRSAGRPRPAGRTSGPGARSGASRRCRPRRTPARRAPDRVRLAGGDDVVVGLVLLQHQPHRPT